MTLPAWLEPLPAAAQMRAVDRWAIEDRGVPSLDLMERAGAGLAGLAAERIPAGRIVVVCGKGNNGGDGLVAARLLREQGREADVLLTADPGELTGDPRANLERLPGAPAARFDPTALRGAAGAIDALLGTGFAGEPREPALGAIQALRAAADDRVVVVAADVPSGVDASTGAVAGDAVHAAATATFHAAKPGLWISPGKQHAGDVRVVPIGIPPGAPVQADVGRILGAVLEAIPHRGHDATKFLSGHVVVCGGSRGLTGAPCLASEAAMRTGAGYVTTCVPASLNEIFEIRLLEVMTRPLADADGALAAAAERDVLEAATRAGALVLGPGMGRSEDALALARSVAPRASVPLVLDADGLNAHAGALEALAGRPAPTVLTPHAGELARLLSTTSAAVGAARLAHAREAAGRAQAIVILKGDDTIVAESDGRVAVSPGGAPALATAGTGDVLSGVLGALLAKRMDPFTAAAAGVEAHRRAGRLAGAAYGPETVIARDVIAHLPAALAVSDR